MTREVTIIFMWESTFEDLQVRHWVKWPLEFSPPGVGERISYESDVGYTCSGEIRNTEWSHVLDSDANGNSEWLYYADLSGVKVDGYLVDSVDMPKGYCDFIPDRRQ